MLVVVMRTRPDAEAVLGLFRVAGFGPTQPRRVGELLVAADWMQPDEVGGHRHTEGAVGEVDEHDRAVEVPWGT